MKIAFIGCGNVGTPLADQLPRLGLAAKDGRSNNIRKVLALNGEIVIAPPREAVAAADVVFLATLFLETQDALSAVGQERH